MANQKKGFNSKSLENLKHAKKGEPTRNPWGRKGKNGLGGFSIKSGAKAFLSLLDEEQRTNFFIGLYNKCLDGDVPAIKLMAELNSELDSNPKVEVGSGAQVVVMVPPREDDPKLGNTKNEKESEK